jgi:hypothetical protein
LLTICKEKETGCGIEYPSLLDYPRSAAVGLAQIHNRLRLQISHLRVGWLRTANDLNSRRIALLDDSAKTIDTDISAT